MSEIKKFIKKTFTFLVILVLLIFIINNFYINNILFQKNIFIKEKNLNSLLKKPSFNGEYLFSGDSHVREGLNPIYFNNSFNYATSGESFILTYYKLNNLFLSNSFKFKSVVLNLDLQKFSSLGTESSRILNNVYFYSDLMPLSVMSSLKNESKASLFLQKKLPFIGNGLDFYEFLSYSKSNDTFLGWNVHLENYSFEEKDLNLISDLHFTDKNLFDTLLVEYFIKIISLVKTHDKQLILVKYPVTSDYLIYAQLKGVNISFFYDQIDKLLILQNSSVLILDYQNFFKNRTDVFSDSSHLNIDGAAIFSKQLAKDLQKLS